MFIWIFINRLNIMTYIFPCALDSTGLDQISMCPTKSVVWTSFWGLGPTVLSQPGASHRENGGYANFDFDILICPRGIVLPNPPIRLETHAACALWWIDHTLFVEHLNATKGSRVLSPFCWPGQQVAVSLITGADLGFSANWEAS